MGAFLRALLSLAIRYIGLLVVIAIGAIIFTEIENLKIVETRKLSDEMKNASMIAKMKIKEELSRTLKVAINSTFFDEMVQKIQDLETDTKPNKWQYMTGAHFAFTIVSTIGKHIEIPVSKYMLNGIVKGINVHYKSLLDFFNKLPPNSKKN